MEVAVIGQGYVGLNVAIAAASAGHRVFGIDHDQKLVDSLSQGNSHVPGISSELIVQLIKNDKYIPTTKLESLSSTSIVIIAVPTPLDYHKKPDLTLLTRASMEVAQNLTQSTLIINESTSYPGTLQTLIKPIFESNSKFLHRFASAPERVDPGNSKWKISNTPRVIGALTNDALQETITFYSTFCSEIFPVSSAEVAEASKLFENTFRQINIALVNEFSKISHVLGFSTHEAIAAASTKPFGFMPFYPSIGVGGHCIPVDPSYLSLVANKMGISAKFIELANQTNLSMVQFVIDRIASFLRIPFDNLTVQVAGITYKPGVSDLRESPALDLINELRNRGARVTWHDPVVRQWNGESSSPLQREIDLGLIITPHDSIDFTIWKNSNFTVLDLSSNNNNYGWPKFL